jgi:hypothetical protein
LRRLSVSPSFCKDIPAALSCYAPSGLLSAGFIPCFREKVFPMLPRQVSGCFFGRVSFLYLVCRILKWDRKTGGQIPNIRPPAYYALIICCAFSFCCKQWCPPFQRRP